jgi:hypothetical protein
MVETCSHLSEVLQKICTTFVHLLLGRKVAHCVACFLSRLYGMPINKRAKAYSRAASLERCLCRNRASRLKLQCCLSAGSGTGITQAQWLDDASSSEESRCPPSLVRIAN